MENICIRYRPITKYDQAPYATITKVINSYDTGPEDDASFYIQLSKVEEKPHWISMGEFLETAYRSKFNDSSFINKCLRAFEKETA